MFYSWNFNLFFMCVFEYFIHGIRNYNLFYVYFVFFKCFYVVEHLWYFNLFMVVGPSSLVQSEYLKYFHAAAGSRETGGEINSRA